MEGGCLGYPGASTVASQPLDGILPPWLANYRNPAMSPIPRRRDSDESKIGEGKGLRAGGSPGPELPKSRGTLQKQLGKEKDTQEIRVK